MYLKWFGALLILAGCGGCGVSMASEHRRREKLLNQLIRALGLLESELQYRLTPLPQLCRMAEKECSQSLRAVFRELGNALAGNETADVASCMDAVLQKNPDLPGKLRRHLSYLGRSLGRFDLPGQIQGLKAVSAACERELSGIRNNAQIHRRSCQTLALCAAAALIILFV